MADRVAKNDGASSGTNRGRIQRDHGGRVGANGVFGDVHDRQARRRGEFHGFFGGALEVIDGPVFDQAANRAGTEKCGGFERHADFFGNFDDGLDVVLMGARRAIRANLHARVDNFARQRFGVRISARAGARQADIHGVNAERFHQVQDFDFFTDAGIVDGRILQAVAQRFIVEHHAATGGNFRAGVGVPVVDEFVLHQ